MNRLHALPLTAAFLLVTVAGCGGGAPREPEIDLDAVLSVTMDSLTEMDVAAPREEGRLSVDGTTMIEPDESETNRLLVGLADVLETNYNRAEPALFDGDITVAAQNDASFVALADTNVNGEPDEGEDALWMIEVDGENARIVATDRSGAVNQSGFSGTGLLAGYLLGSMLSRQRAAGVNTQALANKRTVSPTQAARARAGSGSFSRGK